MDTIGYKSSRVRNAVKGVIGTTVAVPLLFAALPAAAQSQQEQMQELKQQMQDLQTRFDQLKADQGKMQSTETTSTSTSSKPEKGFNVGGTNIQLSGYVKFDAIYDFEDDHGISLGPSDAIATRLSEGTDAPGDSNLGATAKQTRLRLTTTTPTPIGDIGGYIEMDFFGRPYDDTFGGGPSPRVRRAYLTVGNFLIGRDWTTFSDFNYGTMLNFYGPQAQIFERQALVRYTFHFDDNNSLDVAVESPEGQGVFGPDTVNADGSFGGAATSSSSVVDDTGQPIPDFIARYQGVAGPLSFQFAGIVRELEADIGGNDGEETDFGWGLDAGGSLALPTGTTLMASVVGGEGIAKYIYAPAGAPDAYVTDDGDLEAISRWGFIGTISQELTSQLTGNIVYGQAYSEGLEDASYNTDGLHDDSSTIAVNLLYTPVDPLTLGIEYNRSNYETRGGIDADANDIQTSVIYNF